MRKFILVTFLFSLPILVLFLTIEFLLRNDKNSYYALKKKALVEQIDSCKILVLGSSSENSGINPVFFNSKGINLAFVGGTSLDIFNLLILKYVDKMPKLEKVIIPVSTFTFFATEEREEMKFRKILLNRYFGLYDNDFNNILPSSMVLNLGLKKSLKSIFNKQSNNVDKYGFDPMHGNLPECLNDNFGKKTVIRHLGSNNDDIKSNVFNNNINLLDSITLFLKKRNIKVYLITTPTHVSYFKNVNEKIFDMIFKEISKITSKYNTKYYNFISDIRFNDLDFYNCDHLNINGATKFSKILNEEVINKD